MKRQLTLVSTILFLLIICMGVTAGADQLPTKKVYGFKVIHQYPHDSSSFTQGLVIDKGVLYEGTGRYGHSKIFINDLVSGKHLSSKKMPQSFFGEGITVLGDKLIQLTYKARKGFVYDKNRLTLLETFDYPGEGWGITHNGTHLIMSDGSATLYFLDPDSFQQVGTLTVTDGKHQVANLNELEYIQGEIYANIWQQDRIARISPKTGKVIAWVDLTGLLDRENPANKGANVLNGIAYDQAEDRLFVTGKLWPSLFEIELIPKKADGQGLLPPDQ